MKAGPSIYAAMVACLLACGSPDLDSAAVATGAWTEATSEIGLWFQNDVDPDLEVLVVPPGVGCDAALSDSGVFYGGGVHVLYGGQALGPAVPDYCDGAPIQYGLSWLAPTGVEIADQALVVRGVGSVEHGCGERTDSSGEAMSDVELSISAGIAGGGLEVTIDGRGVLYYLLPVHGSLSVSAADLPVSPLSIDSVELAHSQTQFDFTGPGAVEQELAAGGALRFTATELLPWFQLQGHPGLIELDMDHSCERPITERPEHRLELQLGDRENDSGPRCSGRCPIPI